MTLDTSMSLPQIALPQPALMVQSEYEQLRELVLERIGIDLAFDQQGIIERKLAPVMQEVGCPHLAELYATLRSSPGTSSPWERLVSALTVGETHFFRNTPHFDALAQSMLTDLLKRRGATRHVRIWSAGCATGEEPYSVAIMLREMIPNLESWNVIILATDINREALARAQQGVYSAWSFRGVDPRIRNAYFQLNQDKQYVIDDAVKRMVTFGYLNLARDQYPSFATNTNDMDIVLCRNVTIYFRPELTRAVINKFHQCLTDGGWLIPGASEPNLSYYESFESCNFPGAVVYRKRSQVSTRTLPLRLDEEPSPISIPPAPAPFQPPAAPSPADTRRMAEKSPTSDLYADGIALLQTGQWEQALSKLTEKVAQDQDFMPAYYTLAKVQANRGNLEQAQQWCERALDKDKLHPAPYYILSMIYQEQRQLDLALEALRKVIYLDRDFILAHYHMAQLYLRLGHRVLAVKCFENAKKLLEQMPRETPVPEGDGLVGGRLLELVTMEMGNGGDA